MMILLQLLTFALAVVAILAAMFAVARCLELEHELDEAQKRMTR